MDHPKKKICRICNKRYSNGKALGGHMRSHFAKHPLPLSLPVPPPPPKQKQPRTTNTSVSISPSSSSSRKNELSPEFSAVDEHVTMVSTESDRGDQYRRQSNVTRRRSQRGRSSVNSSVSTKKTLISAEDAALFLVMLSRDKWEDAASHDHKRELAKFKCETCNRDFRSSQALGGHKANHSKKMKSGSSDDDHEHEEEKYGSIEEEGTEKGKYNNVAAFNDPPIRSFPCPFCPKSFRSGQALGGHKKVHFSNTLPIRARIGRKPEDSLIIDLNLPAVGDEEVE